MQSENIYKSCVKICFTHLEAENFDIVLESIRPEIVMPIDSKRTNIILDIDVARSCIVISISTSSLSQLRAIINSILYLVNTSVTTINVLRKFIELKNGENLIPIT